MQREESPKAATGGRVGRRVKETKSWQLQANRSAHLGTTNDDIIARWINGDAVKKTIVT